MGGLVASLGVALALGLAGAPGGEGASAEEVALSGEVVELAEVLESRGIEADAGPIRGQVVVRAADGTITPLLADDAGRALFVDERLRHRPAEVLGLRPRGLPYVRVVTLKVMEDGMMRTPEYFCEICTITVRYPQVCPCCQGEMALRYLP